MFIFSLKDQFLSHRLLNLMLPVILDMPNAIRYKTEERLRTKLSIKICKTNPIFTLDVNSLAFLSRAKPIHNRKTEGKDGTFSEACPT